MKRILISVIVFLASQFVDLSICYPASVGTPGAQFLKITPGAKPAAMGGAYVAIAEGADALYWNPAGLNGIDNLDMTAMYCMWVQGVSYQFLGLGKKLDIGTIGISITMLNSGDISGYNDIGAALPNYTMTDTMIGISYAREINNIQLGLSIKNIQEKIADDGAGCMGIDIGMKMDFNEDITLGAEIQNIIGTELGYYTQNHKPPIMIRTGIGYRFPSFLLGIEADLPEDNQINIHAGIEYPYNDNIIFLAGYKTTTMNDISFLSGISLGLGLLFEDFRVEYAFVPYGDLGNTHRLSLSTKY